MVNTLTHERQQIKKKIVIHNNKFELSLTKYIQLKKFKYIYFIKLHVSFSINPLEGNKNITDGSMVASILGNVIKMLPLTAEQLTNSSYAALCRTETTFDNNQIYGGNGVLIDPRIMITAAHNCLRFDPGQGIMKGISMSIKPYGGIINSDKQIIDFTSTTNKYYRRLEWEKLLEKAAEEGSTAYKSIDRKYDYAFVVLDKPFDLPNNTNYFELENINELQSEIVFVASDRRVGQLQMMEARIQNPMQSDAIQLVNEGTIKHRCDYDAGCSGAGIFNRDNNNNLSVIGIHSIGNLQSGNRYAVRISDEVISDSKKVKDVISN